MRCAFVEQTAAADDGRAQFLTACDGRNFPRSFPAELAGTAERRPLSRKFLDQQFPDLSLQDASRAVVLCVLISEIFNATQWSFREELGLSRTSRRNCGSSWMTVCRSSSSPLA